MPMMARTRIETLIHNKIGNQRVSSMNRPFLNLYDIAGVLSVFIPIMALACFCGMIPLKFLLIVIFIFIGVRTIANCDQNNDPNAQQSFGAWAIVLGMMTIICLIWNEMLGLVVGFCLYYSKLWIAMRALE